MPRIYTVEVIEKLNDNQRSIAAVFLDYQSAINYCAIFAEKNGYSEEMVEFEVKEWIPGEMDNLRMIENQCKYIGSEIGANKAAQKRNIDKCIHGNADSCRECEDMVDMNHDEELHPAQCENCRRFVCDCTEEQVKKALEPKNRNQITPRDYRDTRSAMRTILAFHDNNDRNNRK